MLAAFDLSSRSSAVLPQTVQSLGFKPSRRVEIMTTGRGRRRRHRGGTVETDERSQGEQPLPSVLEDLSREDREALEQSVVDEIDADLPEDTAEEAARAARDLYNEESLELLRSTDVSEVESDDEEAVAGNPLDVSGRAALEDDDVLRENPVQRSLSQQLDEEALAAAQDASFDAERFLTAAFEQATQTGVDVTEPRTYYETMQDAIGELPMGQQIEAYAQLQSELSNLGDARIDQRLRESDPEEFARLNDQREYFAAATDDIQDRIERIRARLAQRAVARTPAAGDASPVFQRRGEERSPSPIQTQGFAESGARFSDEESTIQSFRDLQQSAVNDPRDANVSRLQGELSATQQFLQGLQAADGNTKSKTLMALQQLNRASARQIMKDRKLAPAEIAQVAQNVQDRPAVRRMLQQGLVRPNDLVNEGYAAALQTQADTARKLPRRRTSKQVLLDRESVPSRSTRGLKYYRRAQHVRPDIWR